MVGSALSALQSPPYASHVQETQKQMRKRGTGEQGARVACIATALSMSHNEPRCASCSRPKLTTPQEEEQDAKRSRQMDVRALPLPSPAHWGSSGAAQIWDKWMIRE